MEQSGQRDECQQVNESGRAVMLGQACGFYSEGHGKPEQEGSDLCLCKTICHSMTRPQPQLG